MTPGRWTLLQSLFDIALDHPPSERRSILASQPNLDPAVIEEVLQLFENKEFGANLLDPAPARQLRQDLFTIPPLLSPGDQIAQRFQIIRLIGSGGMGEVYEAEDTFSSERIALKTVRLEALGDAAAQKRLQREALLARKITHPNVCHIFDVFPHRVGDLETAILAMELLPGPTLSAHLKQTGPLAPAAAEPIIRQLAAALEAAHLQGVVHRDFKPSNIILVGDRAVVTDFGLAIPSLNFPAAGPALTTLTLSGQIIGTPEYMAPEQIRHRQSSPRSDIYSLGVVMFEMFTGQRPTAGANGLEEILNRLLEPPPSPRSIVPTLNARWEDVILKCLERDPQRRFGSARELLAALDSWWRIPRIPPPSRRALLTSATILSASALGWRYWNQPAALTGSKLLMTTVENKTGDPAFNQIGQLLERQIGQSGRVKTVEPRRQAELLGLMNLPRDTRPNSAQAREMAVRDGASAVLSGSFSTLGSDYELRLRLEPAATGPFRSRQSWTKDFTAPSKRELFAVLDDAAHWIRERAGESAAEIARFDRPAEDTTTSSWEAWRLYSESKSLVAKDDLPAAIALLKEAIRLDPNFAMAWRDRADYEIRLREYQAGYASWATAIQVLDQRKNTSIEAYRTRAMYFEDTGRPAEAEQAYRTILALLPGDYSSQLYLASVVHRLGRPDESLAMFESLVAQNPGKSGALSHLVSPYLSRHRYDEARGVSRRLREAGQLGWATYADYAIAMTIGDPPAALSAAETLAQLKEKTWSIRGPLLLVSFHGYRRAFPELRAALRLALQRAQAESSATWQQRLPIWEVFAALRAPSPNVAALRRQYQSLPAPPPVPESVVEHAFVGHLLGLRVDDDAARQWPNLPNFELPQLQLELLKHPNRSTLDRLPEVAQTAVPHLRRSALEFAVALCQHHNWPATAFNNTLAEGQPSQWSGNETSLPAQT